MEKIEVLRQLVMDRLDITKEISDEQLYEQIDSVLFARSAVTYFPLADLMYYRKTLFDSFRRLDILSEAMDDPSVTEIMVNGPDHIFVEKEGRIMPFSRSFSSPGKLDDIIQQIVSRINRRVDEANPLADARLEDGSRVNIVLPPVSLDGPILTIRRFCKEPPDMDRLILWGAITREAASFLKMLVQSRFNIFISGGTGSGKTTFLGALASFISPDERVITIEDSAELRLAQIKNLVRLEARPASQEGKYAVSIRDLIKNSLRMRPDRIIVGEIRGAEALEMLTAMNTGHNGSMSTGHANSAADMLSRIETMTLMAMELPLPAIRSQIASAIDIIVHLGRLRDKSRKVLSIQEITGMENGSVCLQTLYQFVEKGEQDGKIIGSLEAVCPLLHTEKLTESGFTSFPE